MSNPIMQNQQQRINPMQALQQLKSNPTQFFQKAGLDVPQDIINDPNAIIQHLMNTGKINQQQVNNAYQMAQRLGFK